MSDKQPVDDEGVHMDTVLHMLNAYEEQDR